MLPVDMLQTCTWKLNVGYWNLLVNVGEPEIWCFNIWASVDFQSETH